MAGSTRLRPAEAVGAGPTGSALASGRTTIIDVAAAAGVSRQTVTRAMNDMSGISPGTKRRVLDAAQLLAYRPSRFGRGLVNPHQHALGLLVTDLTNPYYPELASAVIGAAGALGWSVLVAEERHSNDRPAQLAELAGQVDALVGYLYTDSVSLGELDEQLNAMPLVRIDAPPDQRGQGVVGLNIRLAIEQAIELLANHGVRRPVMIDAQPAERPSERAELFCAGWAARGVHAGLVSALDEGAETADGGRAGIERALAEHPDVDGVLCFNDLMALGVLGELRRRGVGVPDQVRVIGVDGLSFGALVSPALTSLAIDLTEVARHAVELAVGIERGELPRSGIGARRTVSYRLLVRESA